MTKFEKKFGGILLVLIIVGVVLIGGYIETHYTIKAKVADVTNEVVTFEDNKTGNLWQWKIEEGESWTLGENVKLSMNTNCTDGIKDDYICRITSTP